MGMEHLTGRYFGPYRLTSILGSGGMGTVFLAHEEELDRPVAVKVLAPSLSKDSNFVERFTREARFLAALSHPNLIHVYSIGSTEDGYHYMAMEYLEGETLDELIDREAPLDVDTTWRITAQVLKALWAIHKAGLVHRDVKPSNIMICRDGRAVLMDFGLAKAHDLPGLTREGIIAGTPEYMSPEQATG
ncbi:MAG: serine/threonine protein kinase, partial [Planctomycetota bacterium]